jgi:hypothetical protein
VDIGPFPRPVGYRTDAPRFVPRRVTETGAARSPRLKYETPNSSRSTLVSIASIAKPRRFPRELEILIDPAWLAPRTSDEWDFNRLLPEASA